MGTLGVGHIGGVGQQCLGYGVGWQCYWINGGGGVWGYSMGVFGRWVCSFGMQTGHGDALVYSGGRGQ